MRRSLHDAWHAVLEVKGAERPVTSSTQAEDLGAAWIKALCDRHEITQGEFEEMIEIDAHVLGNTLESLMLIRRSGESFSIGEMAAIIHASGFSNGLALGLEANR